MKLQKISAENYNLHQLVVKQQQYAFYPSPGSKEEIEKFRPYNKETIYLGLFVDGTMQAAGSVAPITQNIRGKLFKMGGVADITSYPEYRRQGNIKKIMDGLFAEMRKGDYAVTTLYPFRQSFYGKMGYVTLPQTRVATLTPHNLRFTLQNDISGKYERAELKEKIHDYIAFKKNLAQTTHTFAYFTDTKMQQYKELNNWVVFAKVAGEIVGMLVYKITGFEGKLEAREFLYKNTQGKYLILNWLALHVDQVKEIFLPLFTDEQLELWQNDLKTHICSRKWVPSAMARVFDISKLEGISVGTGSFIVSVEDQQCEWNSGTWKFNSEHGQLHVEKVETAAPVVSVHAISALVYGAYNTADFEYLGWGKPNMSVQAAMQQLFPPLTPRLNVQF